MVVQLVDAVSVTPGGIVLPDAAKEKSQRAKVLSVGGDLILGGGQVRSTAVKPNDEVIVRSYAGTDIEIDGKELQILNFDDVLAIVNK